MTETTDTLPADTGSLTRLASRVFDTPLLIHEGKLSQILGVLGPRLGFDLAKPLDPPRLSTPAEHQAIATDLRWEWNDNGYYNVGRAAVIPVVGSLVQRSSWLDSLSGFLSYDKVEKRLAAAIDDNSIDEIVIDYDTPGGEAAGAFDAADRLVEMRGAETGKTVTAVVNELAASAGYLLASAADEILVPRTGIAGSIGVVSAHVDMSEQLEQRGIAVTFIYAGDKKVDGNPYQPLSARARADWQAEIDAMYDIFVGSVARNRGIPEASVRKTQAGLFMGEKARETGLADRSGTLKGQLEFIASKRRSIVYSFSSSKEETTMTKIEQEERDKAIAQARAEGLEEGRKLALAEQAEAEAKKAEAAKAEAEKSRTAVMTAVLDTELPADIQMALMKGEGAGADNIAARIEHATTVADLCKVAGKPELAKSFVTGNTPVAAVREQLSAIKADNAGPEIDVSLPDRGGNGAQQKPSTATEVYNRRRETVASHHRQ